MTSRNRVTALFACVLSLASGAFAQKTRPLPTFKAKAELVLVPALVTRDHQPVRGLKAEDFVLLHDGKQQRIAVFEEVEPPRTRVPDEALPAQTARNFSQNGERRDTVVLLLDFLNMDLLGRERLQDDMSKIAKVFVDTNADVHVLILSWFGLVELLPRGADPNLFLRAAEDWERATRKGPSDLVAAQYSGVSRVLLTYGTSMSRAPSSIIDHKTQAFDTVSMTLAAVEEIAQAYKGVPGIKKLVWISARIPIYVKRAGGMRTIWLETLPRKYVRAIQALSDANMVLYPVLMNHLYATGGGAGACGMEPVEFYFRYTFGEGVCDDTPHKCVTKAVEDARHYYLLGFYLAGKTKPGYHKLKVKVDRPQVSVKSREVFIAGDWPSNISVLATEEAFFEAAAKSPIDYTDLPFELRWSAMGPVDGKYQVELAVRVPPSTIVLDDEASPLNLTFRAYVTPEGEEAGREFGETLAGAVSDEQQSALKTGGFLYRKTIGLEPGRYKVRVLLRDNTSNRVGTVSTDIDVQGMGT